MLRIIDHGHVHVGLEHRLACCGRHAQTGYHTNHALLWRTLRVALAGTVVVEACVDAIDDHGVAPHTYVAGHLGIEESIGVGRASTLVLVVAAVGFDREQVARHLELDIAGVALLGLVSLLHQEFAREFHAGKLGTDAALQEVGASVFEADVIQLRQVAGQLQVCIDLNAGAGTELQSVDKGDATIESSRQLIVAVVEIIFVERELERAQRLLHRGHRPLAGGEIHLAAGQVEFLTAIDREALQGCVLGALLQVFLVLRGPCGRTVGQTHAAEVHTGNLELQREAGVLDLLVQVVRAADGDVTTQHQLNLRVEFAVLVGQ